MVYIVIEYPAGHPDFATEIIFNNKIKAYQYCSEVVRCQGSDIDIELYEADNEYTNKRYLIKKY